MPTKIPTYQERFSNLNCCVLIPTYNNDHVLATVIDEVLQRTTNVIVVNDGSNDNTENILKNYDHIVIHGYPDNKGKGHALRLGFELARNLGYDYAITIDSDGQHRASDLPVFLEKLEEEPEAIIVGARNMEQENVPGGSSFGHKFSNFWFRFETGIDLPDTQSGYRLYPVRALEKMKWFTSKYEFEIEVLVRSAWKGIAVIPVPIDVYYPPQEERVTHFRKFWDFSRISVLNTILVLIAVLFVKPFKFLTYLKKNTVREFVEEYFVGSSESNSKLASSIGFGVFMGIVPLWGYQIITAIVLAQLLKLNKVIVVVASHVSIPPMIPFIIWGSIIMGGVILNKPTAGIDLSSFKNFQGLTDNLFQYVVGSVALALISAAVFGVVSYLALSFFRKKTTQSVSE